MQAFVQYPPPWTAVYSIIDLLRIDDAAGKCIAEAAHTFTTCHLIWDMYRYVDPRRGRDSELPVIFNEYPFPWQYMEITAGSGPWVMVTAATGRLIPCTTRPRLVPCLQDLERLVVAKHSSQQRGRRVCGLV